MKRSGWRGPSPALVIACLALFVALGGTVLAATKIDGKTIKVKSLPGNRLKLGSVPGNRIAAHSLTGDRIKVDTLGEVPSAAHAGSADSARHAQTAIAADHATDATTVNGHAVGCPTGRRQFAGACWEMEASTAQVNAPEAAEACAARGGELPSALALTAFAKQPGVTLDVGGEWTDQIGNIGELNDFGVVVVLSGWTIDAYPSTWQRHFRCVSPLVT
ncbi:MAG: hypothetical protein JST08_07085 [Actinobacteria bacterium]|nr:hypothetical protein [Actinomycetota bacterium]